MKMKHCDMPRPMPQKPHPHPLQSPLATVTRQTPLEEGSVAQHIQKFLLSQEPAELKPIEAPTSVREFSRESTRPNFQVQKPKPRSTSNQSAKQVRFDIKHGLQDLIKETGIDLKPRSSQPPSSQGGSARTNV